MSDETKPGQRKFNLNAHCFKTMYVNKIKAHLKRASIITILRSRWCAV